MLCIWVGGLQRGRRWEIASSQAGRGHPNWTAIVYNSHAIRYPRCCLGWMRVYPYCSLHSFAPSPPNQGSLGCSVQPGTSSAKPTHALPAEGGKKEWRLVPCCVPSSPPRQSRHSPSVSPVCGEHACLLYKHKIQSQARVNVAKPAPTPLCWR